MNEKIMKALGFDKELEAAKHGFCPICKKPVGEFRDRESVKEFNISGMCQACQDKTFGGEE